FMRNAHVLAHEAVGQVLFRFKLLMLVYHEHLHAGIHQERAKDVQYPVEFSNKGGADGDKDGAENNGHQDADQQHAGVAGFRYLEKAEDEYEYKNVVDGQRPFHEVSAQVADGHFRTVLKPYKSAECKGKP